MDQEKLILHWMDTFMVIREQAEIDLLNRGMPEDALDDTLNGTLTTQDLMEGYDFYREECRREYGMSVTPRDYIKEGEHDGGLYSPTAKLGFWNTIVERAKHPVPPRIDKKRNRK